MNLPFKKFTREKRNVSSIKEMQWKHAQLEQNKSINLPLQDYLTELPNRISFQLEMKKLIQIGKPFSVVILDLDRFKHINMNLGQRIADKFLQNVSQYMIDYLSEDYRLARIGGDKFGIFLQKMQAEDEVKAFVSNLIRYLNTSFIIDKQEIHLTASAGISSYPEHGKTADTLLKSAELALSQAKKIGRKKFVLFSPDIENQFTKQYYIERDLRNALEENQFELLFQPRVEAKTGKIVKAEALLRWNHPILGPLTPEEFIPLAEEIGLIYRMTNWVMNEVAQFIEQVKETEVPIVPISVNISSNYFLQKDWKEHLNTLLDKTHIHPSLIEFEITESTRIHHEEKMQSDLEFLREKGFSIALDDFGKGFSSISHIQKFPIQTIKIDQSFTEDVVTSQKTNRLVKSLIVLAKNLNLDIVAEGVETKEQLDFGHRRWQRCFTFCMKMHNS